MSYKRKTRDTWQLLSNYGYGWDFLANYESKKDALIDLKAYYENETGAAHKIIKKRMKICD